MKKIDLNTIDGVKNLLTESNRLINESNSVSLEIALESRKILDAINNDLKKNYKKHKIKYAEVFKNSFYYKVFNDENNLLNIYYTIADTSEDDMFKYYQNTFDGTSNSFSSEKEIPIIYVQFVTFNGRIKKTYKNIEKIVHEFTHFFQYYKSGYNPIIKKRDLYFSAQNENENNKEGTLRKDLGNALYLSEKAEIDASIQQFSEFMKKCKNGDYTQSKIYKRYEDILNIYNILKSFKEDNNQDMISKINSIYFDYYQTRI